MRCISNILICSLFMASLSCGKNKVRSNNLSSKQKEQIQKNKRTKHHVFFNYCEANKAEGHHNPLLKALSFDASNSQKNCKTLSQDLLDGSQVSIEIEDVKDLSPLKDAKIQSLKISKSANFDDIETLKSFKSLRSLSISDTDLASIDLQDMPDSLKELEISNNDNLISLRSKKDGFKIEDLSLVNNKKLASLGEDFDFSQIKTMDLSQSPIDLTTAAEQDKIKECTQLESFKAQASVDAPNDAPNFNSFDFLDNLESLKELDLSYNKKIPLELDVSIASLETLSLKKASNFSEANLKEIITKCPNLKSLNLSSQSNLSYDVLDHFFKNPSILITELDISDCPKIKFDKNKTIREKNNAYTEN